MVGDLCDREALSVWLKRSPETIRKRCPVADRTADHRSRHARAGPAQGEGLLRCPKPREARHAHTTEAFGPVATLMAYDSLDDAVALMAMGNPIIQPSDACTTAWRRAELPAMNLGWLLNDLRSAKSVEGSSSGGW